MSKQAQERYDKANTTQFKMKLNTKTDADIIDWLDKQPNKQGKVKQLIREELSNTEKIYLIYNDSIDDSAEIIGYIKGTKEDADKYCEEYNKKCTRYWQEVYYEELDNLTKKQKKEARAIKSLLFFRPKSSVLS